MYLKKPTANKRLFIVINVYDEGKEAHKEYAEKHTKDKSRKMYVYHTKNDKLLIEERRWVGSRRKDETR